MVDETILVERVAEALWNAQRLNDSDDNAWENALAGHKRIFRAYAEAAISVTQPAIEALQQELDVVLTVVDELYRKYETELDAEDVAIVQAARTALQNGASNGR